METSVSKTLGPEEPIDFAQARRRSSTLKTGSDAEVAGKLLDQYEAEDGARPIAHGRELYRYNRTTAIWAAVTQNAVKRDLIPFDGKSYGEKGVYRLSAGKAKGVVELMIAFVDGGEELEHAGHMLVFEDVAIEVCTRTWTLNHRQLGPTLYQRHAHPSVYVADATAPRFLAALQRLFSTEEIVTLQEFAGAAVFGLGRWIGKALLIQGLAGVGKSAILDIMTALMPEGAVSNVLPHDFGHRFRAQQLDGALLNISNELPRAELEHWHMLKTVISCEGMTMEGKGEKPYRATPRAAQMFACNYFPRVADATPDFWDRWLVLQVTADKIRGTDNEVRHFAAELVEQERAGILAWLVEGASTFARHRGRIAPCESAKRSLDAWRGVADTVAMWFGEECEADTETAGSALPRLSRAFSAYKQWCRKNQHDATPMYRFKQWLEDRHLVAPVTHGNAVYLQIRFS